MTQVRFMEIFDMPQALSKRPVARTRSWLDNGPLATMRRDFEDLLEGFWDQDSALVESGAIAPRFDLSETDTSIEVHTDLPGIKPEEVNVELQENCLVISAEHKEEKETKPEEGRKYHRIERRHGRFARSVWLPCPVDETGIEAKLADGVLTVTLPKTKQAQKRKISVNGG